MGGHAWTLKVQWIPLTERIWMHHILAAYIWARSKSIWNFNTPRPELEFHFGNFLGLEKHLLSTAVCNGHWYLLNRMTHHTCCGRALKIDRYINHEIATSESRVTILYNHLGQSDRGQSPYASQSRYGRRFGNSSVRTSIAYAFAVRFDVSVSRCQP